MPGKRAVAEMGARAVGGLIGIVVAVGAFGAAVLTPWPTLERAPASLEVAPTPTEQQRVCPGPLLTLAEDSSQAEAATSVGRAAAVYGARAQPTGAAPSAVTDLSAVDNAQSARDGSPLLLSVPAPEGATSAPLVAGSQSQTAAGEMLGGLAVAACTEAASDSWLVGGSTDVGRTSLVVLSNPTTVVARVDLTVFGETGAVDAPGSTGILVQPGTQRIISLAGLAPNIKSPVVRVQSQGGQVAAALEQSVIRGLAPAGVEWLAPSTAPALDQVIPGLIVTKSAAAGAPAISDGASEETPSVRVLVPGNAPATVQIGVISEDGKADGTSAQIEVQPGIATEVPFPELTPGSFSVRLESDEPIVTAGRSTVTGASKEDFAWFASAAAVTGDFMVAVASGPTPLLHLVNVDGADADVTVTAENGAPRQVTVPAGQATVLSVAAGARYVVSGGAAIAASVSYAGNGLISSFALSPAGPLAAPIRLYPH